VTYLGYPRLHFAGRFQADPSTVNNDPAHFDNDRFVARFQKRQTLNAPNGWWNPQGSGAWHLHDCRVTSVLYDDGTVVSSPEADPIVGGALVDANDRVSAKIVDLDPQWQMVSQIWGLRLQLSDSSGRPAFVGGFAPASLADLWPRFPRGMPDSFFGAAFQSVLSGVQWPKELPSKFLRDLKRTARQGLSIKLNVDGFDDNAASPTFTHGRVVGSIGPYERGEPRHFVAARMLWPIQGYAPSLNAAPCRIDPVTNTLFIDLGNSLPTVAAGGPLQELGVLWVVALPAYSPPVILTPLANLSGGFYEQLAGIVSAPLTQEQAAVAARSRIGILDASGTALLLAENASATYLRADEVVFRLSPRPPDNSASANVFATRYGVPAASMEIAVWHQAMTGPVEHGPVNRPRVGIPEAALAFPQSLRTGADGRAKLPLVASPPGNPRGYIDGQVYTIAYGVIGDPTQTAANPISVLVWDDYNVPDHPTWVGDVQPILQRYANLYPVMRTVLDLDDYSSVVQHREMLRHVFELPVEDPNYMPVTRDLSPAKRAMLLNWLGEQYPPAFATNDLACLRRMLQLAIELEHAVIPPYLCALFSIRPGRNVEIASRLRSVVIEEMLHMALACNLLVAVGGEPQIDKPAFVPRYPCRLPAGVLPDLTVSLGRCTRERIRDVFMRIEEPEQHSGLDGEVAPSAIDARSIEVDEEGTIVSPHADLAQALERRFIQVECRPQTFGWFYQHIARAIIELDKAGDPFVGDPARQLTPKVWPASPGRLYRITNKASALIAIHEIVTQGEGRSLADPANDQGELAHYYRFREIVEGRQLVRRAARPAHGEFGREQPSANNMIGASGEWAFEGPAIIFDPKGVFPMIDDPDTDALPAQSPAKAASELFDRSYVGLLQALHDAVNGNPDAVRDAIGLMFSLDVQARRLMEIPISPGSPTVAGPSFRSC
jgi:hypothetical protein